MEFDKRLWERAKKRVEFKNHLFAYVVINLFLVAIWAYISHLAHANVFFWPVFPIFGWGIGLLFHYWSAYHDNGRMIEREYERLRKEKGNE